MDQGGRLTLQPSDVFLLLLIGNVVGDHVLELDVQTTLLQVAAPECNQLRVEVLSGGTGVEALAGPVLLGGLGVGGGGVLEVRDLLDLEIAILDDGLDQQSAVIGLLDSDVDASREGGRQDFILAVGVAALLGLGLVVTLIAQGFVRKLIRGILGDVVNVGDGKGNTNAAQKKKMSMTGRQMKRPEQLTSRCQRSW